MKRPRSWQRSTDAPYRVLARLADPLMRRIEARRLHAIGPVTGLKSVCFVRDHQEISKESLLEDTLRALRDGVYVARPSPFIRDAVVLHPERAASRRREILPQIRFGAPIHAGMQEDGFDPCGVALSILSTPFVDDVEAARLVSALERMAAIHASETIDPTDDLTWAVVQCAPTPWTDGAAIAWTNGAPAQLAADGVVLSHPDETCPPTVGQEVVALPPCLKVRIHVAPGNRSCLHVGIGPLTGHVTIPSPASSIGRPHLDAMETFRIIEDLRREFPT